MIVTDFMRPTN